jgi:hypothetical protein
VGSYAGGRINPQLFVRHQQQFVLKKIYWPFVFIFKIAEVRCTFYKEINKDDLRQWLDKARRLNGIIKTL